MWGGGGGGWQMVLLKTIDRVTYYVTIPQTSLLQRSLPQFCLFFLSLKCGGRTEHALCVLLQKLERMCEHACVLAQV